MFNKLKGGIVGDVAGQIGGLGKQIGIGVVKAGSDAVKSAPKQVVPITPEQLEKKSPEQLEKEVSSGGEQAVVQKSGQNEDFVKALYGSSDSSKKNTSLESLNNPSEQVAQKIAEEHPEKSQEEIQKLTALRQQLHKEGYYDPTFNPQRQQAEEASEEQEEKQEEQEEMWKKEEEKKKKEEEKKASLQKPKNKIEQRPGAG